MAAPLHSIIGSEKFSFKIFLLKVKKFDIISFLTTTNHDLRGNLMKRTRTVQDEEIKGRIAMALKKALKKRGKTPEEAAKLLEVELGTMYKYLAASMIPGGHVLWRACKELGMVLDERGLRVARSHYQKATLPIRRAEQYELPFINESFGGDQVRLTIGKKDIQSTGYVHVALRIKVAS
jgi:transcriptional regulator with XRE-family HTH domain